MSSETPRAPVKPLRLLEDEPISGVDRDGLQLDRYARVIAATALGTDGPFTTMVPVVAAAGQEIEAR